jgi:hypothetical protein
MNAKLGIPKLELALTALEVMFFQMVLVIRLSFKGI